MTVRRWSLLTSFAALVSVPVLSASDYRPLRYEEDFSHLRDPANRSDFLDPLKFIPLSSSGRAALTLGGEARVRTEYFRNAFWGEGPQDDNGYLLLRTMLHADWHLHPAIRIFTQLKSGLERGRVGGPRPTDENRADLHQAFLDVKRSTGEGNGVFTFRAGRQEIVYGSSRLLSFREGPNVRLSFDGVRAIYERGAVRADAFSLAAVETDPGSFDDATDSGRKLWGAYAVVPLSLLPGGHLDAYYLGVRRRNVRFDQGTGNEDRHSVGARIWGGSAGWNYNIELVMQFGTFGADRITAWTAASELRWTLAAVSMKPRLCLRANISSGDRDPTDSTLETFNALFPRGSYFGESGLMGPANLVDLHPGVEFNPTPAVSASVDWNFFWRESVSDGLYGPAINLLRSGQGSRSRTIGNQVSLTLEWQAGRHWSIHGSYAHFFADRFLRETGAALDVDYAGTWITYRF